MTNQGPEEFPHVVVAAAIVQRGEKILITRRPLGVHQGGLWEFPGGKQEVGETLEECLRRELKEEIDIMVGAVTPFYTLCHRYPEKAVSLHFFTCSLSAGSPRPLGCTELAWVSQAELPSYQFPEADRPVVIKLLENFLERQPCP